MVFFHFNTIFFQKLKFVTIKDNAGETHSC